jgi:hypothetical protein
MFLDPLKRIPMKLIYNGNILLDGYAKYTSATVNAKETYYTFNLHGVLGDIFQSLLDCVVDSTKLTDEQKAEPDGGAKYVISSTWDSQVINKDFVKASWDDKLTSIATSATNPHRHIGMAPAYRGLYSDFESNSILGLDYDPMSTDLSKYEVISVEDGLKKHWFNVLTNLNGYTEENANNRVDSLDFNMILPNGLNEHNMRQFRSYEQKPYIYFYSLMNLYQKKCKELTGYEIKLDSSWFNINNPYWTRLCYMFDYLSVKGATIDSSLPFTGYSEQMFKEKYCNASATYEITDSSVLSKGNLTIDPYTLGLRIRRDIPSTCVNQGEVKIQMKHRSCVVIDMEITTGGTTTHKYFWGGTGTPSTTANVGPETGSPSKYPDDEYIYMTEDTEWDRTNNQWVYTAGLTTKSFEIPHTPGDSISITYKVQFIRTYVAGDYYGWSCLYKSTDGKEYSASIPQGEWGTDEWLNVVENPNFKFIFPNVTYSSNWRTSTTCDLKNLYTKDESLFNVILQYTKMFGLIWKPDYQNKTIDLMTRKSYFKDYEVVDWTDKVDKSKGLTIEPVSFNSKYVIFNYEDVEGYRYSGYKNKYGVDYGEKKIRTKYNFDTKEYKLFSQKMHPSSISCKSYSTIQDLWNWDTLATLVNRESDVNMIDCEDNAQTSSITLNNWYFRNENIGTDYPHRISDASEREISDGKYYWLDNGFGIRLGCITETYVLPQFSPVFPASAGNPTIGCLFNCPNDDYTKDFQISSAQGNYIYDVCWGRYINERYNANNKKVTCYVKLSPAEYEQFNFKTFVTVDNQLFVVNKIQDYDVNNVVTKVELIQVSDINGYTAQNIEFKEVIYYGDEINISPSVSTIDGNSYVGYGGIKVRCYPRLDGVADITITKISGDENSKLVAYDWQADEEDIEENDPLTPVNAGDGTLIFRWSAPSFNASEEWRIKITAFGESRYIPVYISYN